MGKKDTASTNANIKIEGSGNNIHVGHKHVGDKKASAKKGKKPNWLVKAIVVAAIGLVCSVILIYVKHSTSANGKPAYIQGGTAPIERNK